MDTRQYARTDVLVDARLLCGGAWHDCQVVNISAGGARLRIDGDFDQNEQVSLEIGKFGNFTVLVAWKRSEEIGVIFAEDPEVMANVVMGLAMYA